MHLSRNVTACCPKTDLRKPQCFFSFLIWSNTDQIKRGLMKNFKNMCICMNISTKLCRPDYVWWQFWRTPCFMPRCRLAAVAPNPTLWQKCSVSHLIFNETPPPPRGPFAAVMNAGKCWLSPTDFSSPAQLFGRLSRRHAAAASHTSWRFDTNTTRQTTRLRVIRMVLIIRDLHAVQPRNVGLGVNAA